MQRSIFLLRKVMSGTFPLLGKQGIYLLLNIGITRNLSPKTQQMSPIFWYSLPIFISLHGYFAGKTCIFLKAWLKQT